MIRSLLLALCLCGCSPYWVKTAEPSHTVRMHYVDAELGRALGRAGWAFRRSDGSCDAYVVRDLPNRACVESHERMHCAGYDHPKYEYAIDCF